MWAELGNIKLPKILLGLYNSIILLRFTEQSFLSCFLLWGEFNWQDQNSLLEVKRRKLYCVFYSWAVVGELHQPCWKIPSLASESEIWTEKQTNTGATSPQMAFRALLGLSSEILSRELIHSFPQNATELWLSKVWKKKIWGSLWSLAVWGAFFTIVQELVGNPEISHLLFFWSSGFILCCEQQFIRNQTDKAKTISFVNSPGQGLGTYKAMALFFPHWGFVFHVGTQSQEQQREGEILNSGAWIWTILQCQHVLHFSLKGSSVLLEIKPEISFGCKVSKELF